MTVNITLVLYFFVIVALYSTLLILVLRREKKRRKIVYIDMDDTICHFFRHAVSSRHTYPEYLPWPQSRPGFFLELEPIAGAKEVIAKLQEKYDVWILTKPSYMNPHCYTEKRLWIEQHYGLAMCEKLILCPDKGLLQGDYLIDDVLWKGFKGRQLHYGNGAFKTWDDIEKYLLP